MTRLSQRRDDPIRIANCSGFFGDRLSAARELLDTADIDVLTGDWLAELTMAILAGQRSKDPHVGYARSFLTVAESVLASCVERGVPIVANAGGLNPAGCAAAVERLADRLGVRVRAGYVDGDDLLHRVDTLSASGQLTDFGTGRPLDLRGCETLAANAYLGGWAIASCLSRGADVVVTGRVTDAALTVGPAAAAFGWAVDDWDALAGSVVAGHIIECGAQATGGNYSFFDREVPRLRRIGFPIAEVHPDGSAVITKAPGSDGAVTVGTVTAQLLYEVGGPRYLNPDVVALLDTVRLSPAGPDRVRVTGTRGAAPPPGLKVSVALSGGYRNSVMLGITGADPESKARAALEAIWAAVPGGRDAFEDVSVELIGRPKQQPDAELGAIAAATCVLRIAVSGRDPAAVGRGFSSAVVETGLASYPGFFSSGPPTGASAFTRYRPAIVVGGAVRARAVIGADVEEFVPVGVTHGVADEPLAETEPPPGPEPLPGARLDCVRVALHRVIGARSGDKGGDANVGVWSRDDRTYAWLADWLTTRRFRELVPEAARLRVDRHPLPNLRAINFVVVGFLGDGVSSCLRFDGQAKGLAEYVRSREVDVPRHIVKTNDGGGQS